MVFMKKKRQLIFLLIISLQIIFLTGPLSAEERSKDLYRFLRSGKWGLISDSGTLMIEPIYDYVFSFKNGYSVVKGQVSGESRRAYISSEGFQITGFEYQQARHFFGDLAAAKKEDKWGYINRNGEEVTLFEYDRVSDFDYGVGVARKGSEYFLVFPDGRIQAFPGVSSLYFSSQGGTFKQEDQWGLMDFDGTILLPPSFESLSIINEDLLKIRENKLYGLADRSGRILLPPRYERLYSTEDEGVFRVRENGSYRFITLEGNQFLDSVPYTISQVWKKLLRVQQNGFYGIFNRESQEVVPPMYQGLQAFDINGNSGFLVIQNDLKGIMDQEGNWIVEPFYDRIYPFSEGLALVVKNGKYGFINDRGELQIPLEFDRAWDFKEGLAVVRQGSREDGKRGYIDQNGRITIPLQFDWAYSFHKGMAHVAFGSFAEGTFGYIDREGNYLVEPGN